MMTLTDELERFRQQMIEDARENEVERRYDFPPI